MRLNDRRATDDTKSVVEMQLWGAGLWRKHNVGVLAIKLSESPVTQC